MFQMVLKSMGLKRGVSRFLLAAVLSRYGNWEISAVVRGD